MDGAKGGNLTMQGERSENFLTRYAWVPLLQFSVVMRIVGIGGITGPVGPVSHSIEGA